MTASEIYERIQKLDLPGRIKRELMAMYHSCKRLVEAILRFMARHKHFNHCVLLGAIVCWLLCMLPVAIAHHLGLIALVTVSAVGLMQDLRDTMTKEFVDIKV